MNSSGIVMVDGAVISAGRVHWRRRNETRPRRGLLSAVFSWEGACSVARLACY